MKRSVFPFSVFLLILLLTLSFTTDIFAQRSVRNAQANEEFNERFTNRDDIHIIVEEDFEGHWPTQGWTLLGDPTWGVDDAAHHSGQRALWCARGGDNGVDPAGGRPYPEDFVSTVTFGPFDINQVDWETANISYWYKCVCERSDRFYIGVSTNGEDFEYRIRDSQEDWTRDIEPFTNFYNRNDLDEQDQVWVRFTFISYEGEKNTPGCWIDDVRIALWDDNNVDFEAVNVSLGTAINQDQELNIPDNYRNIDPYDIEDGHGWFARFDYFTERFHRGAITLTIRVIDIDRNQGIWSTNRQIQTCPAGMRSYTVYLEPDHPALRPGTYALDGIVRTGNDPNGENDWVRRVYIIVGPEVSLDPERLEFNEIAVGNMQVLPLYIENTGSQDLSILPLDFIQNRGSHFQYVSARNNYLLEPGDRRFFLFRFRPLTPGDKSAVFRFETNDRGNNPLDVEIRGRAIPALPDIHILQDNLRFVDTPIGSHRDVRIAIQNLGRGNSNLRVTATTLNNNSFRIMSGGAPFTLASNEQRYIDVRFQPVEPAGEKNAILAIISNDPDERRVQIQLSGTAIDPAANLAVIPSPVDFGETIVGQPVDRTIRIMNNGGGDPLSIRGYSTGNGFTWTQFPYIGRLDRGESRTIHLRFRATEPLGEREGALIIRSSDPDEPELSVPLRAILNPPQVPDIAVDPENLAFGTVSVGESVERTLTVSNEGVVELNVSNTRIIGNNAGQYQIQDGGGQFDLEPDEEREIVVRFRPTSNGIKHETWLRIESDDPDERILDVPLRGTGLDEREPDIACDLEVVDWGDVQLGAWYRYNIPIRNDGNLTLEIQNIEFIGPYADYFEIVAGGTSFNLFAERERVIPVHCTADERGAIANTIMRITSNDPDEGTFELPLACNGVAPDIELSADIHEFGEVDPGQDRTWGLIVSNRGNSRLRISGISLEGNNADQFSFSGRRSFNLETGESEMIDITFDPESLGNKQARLVIESNSYEEEEVGVNLFGSCVHYGSVAYDPMHLEFDVVIAGETAERIVNISNDGDLEVTFDNMFIEGDGIAADFENEITLEPGADFDLTVTFTPEEGDWYDGTIFLHSDQLRDNGIIIPYMGFGEELNTITYFLYFGTYIPGQGPGPLMRISVDGEPVQEGEVFTIPNYDLRAYNLGESFQTYMDGMSGTEALFEPGAIDEDIEIHLVLNNIVVQMGQPIEFAGIHSPDQELQDALWMFADFQVWSIGPDSVQLNDMMDYMFNMGEMVVTFNLDDEYFAMLEALNLDYDRFGAALWAPDEEEWMMEGITSLMTEDNELELRLGHLSIIGGCAEGIFHDGGKFVNIPLNEGWNMISLNILPAGVWTGNEGPDVELMFNQLRVGDQNQAMIVKDEFGRFYAPNHDFNGIDHWDLTRGYKVKAYEDTELSFTGIEIAEDAEIELHRNWNIAAYYPTRQIPARAPEFEVLAPILDHVIIAKDITGSFMVPAQRFSNMTPWRETQGYLIKVDEDVTLVYPQREDGDFLAETGNKYAGGPWDQPANTGENMSVLIREINGYLPSEGDRAAALNTDGDIVGLGSCCAGKFGLAVWGDDPTTDVKDGLADGEAFELELWSAIENRILPLTATNFETGAGLTYETDAFTALDAVADAAVPQEYFLSAAYPNPFNSMVRINYGLPFDSRVSIKIYDVQGREAATLVNREMKAGVYTIPWTGVDDAGNMLSSGLYFCRIQSGEFVKTRKLMLIK